MVKNTVIEATPGDVEFLPSLVGRSRVPLRPARSAGWSPFLRWNRSHSATLPPAVKAHGGKQR